MPKLDDVNPEPDLPGSPADEKPKVELPMAQWKSLRGFKRRKDIVRSTGSYVNDVSEAPDATE
jgi:hypothetical protein